MRADTIALLVTGFFLLDAYYDGRYVSAIKKGKKYYKMIGIAFAGYSTYLFLRKNPSETGEIIRSASGVVRSLPVDHRSLGSIMEPLIKTPPQSNRKHKRSVGETKKKFVASQQGWKCADCGEQLTAWFEVDHKIRLDRGGSNETDNLTALCRNCHGKKTALENM